VACCAMQQAPYDPWGPCCEASMKLGVSGMISRFKK
jgi:hypothetical protein